MKKFRCQNCGVYCYSAADQTICSECRGELKEVDMAETAKAPSEAATSLGASEINLI